MVWDSRLTVRKDEYFGPVTQLVECCPHKARVSGSSPGWSTTGSYDNLTLSEGMRMVKHGSIGCTTGELSAKYKKIGGSLYYFVLWCNWQHVGFWYRRVEVRALVGQQNLK